MGFCSSSDQAGHLFDLPSDSSATEKNSHFGSLKIVFDRLLDAGDHRAEGRYPIAALIKSIRYGHMIKIPICRDEPSLDLYACPLRIGIELEFQGIGGDADLFVVPVEFGRKSLLFGGRLAGSSSRDRHGHQATGDIRKVSLWLGHSSIQSTGIYTLADPTEKLEAIVAINPPSLRRGRFRPPHKLIELLRKS
jgi:hypothetical protein